VEFELSSGSRPLGFSASILNQEAVPELASSDLDDVICHEMRVRWSQNQSIGIREFVNAIGRTHPDLPGALHELAYAVRPLSVALETKGHRCAETMLDWPLSIGRQDRGEPLPISHIRESGKQKIVVAGIDDRYVSRSQLTIEYQNPERILITNNGGTLKAILNSHAEVAPNDVAAASCPTIIHLGAFVLKVSEYNPSDLR